jgi:hypothetical protein
MKRRLLTSLLAILLLASPALAQTKIVTVATTSGQTVQFTSLGAFNTLILTCAGLTTTTGTNGYVNVQFSTNGGTSYDNTWANYTWGNLLTESTQLVTDSASNEAANGSGVGVIVLHQPQASSVANTYAALTMTFTNVHSTTVYPSYFWQSYAYDLKATDTFSYQGEGGYLGGGGSAVNAIQLITGLLSGTATFATGTCTLYGDN